MSLSKSEWNDLLVLLDDVDDDQRLQVYYRLLENPIQKIDPVVQATKSFDGLDELQAFKFIKEIKKRYDYLDWKELVIG